jgi:hypothetical protein
VAPVGIEELLEIPAGSVVWSAGIEVLSHSREEGLRTKQPAIGRQVPKEEALASSPVESEPE